MKRFTRLLFIVAWIFFYMGINANTFAQSKAMPVIAALNKVSKQYNVKFVYEKKELSGLKTAYDFDDARDKGVEEVLKGILYPEGLLFLYVKKNYYAIVKGDRQSLPHDGTLAANSPANQRKTDLQAAQNNSNSRSDTTFPGISNRAGDHLLSGKVVDSLGNPLAGVSVRVVGTNRGAITRADGTYALEALKPATLEFSSVGYITRRITAGFGDNSNVVLHENKTGLGEVVVVGYGTQRKIDLTGSISTIDSKEISQDHSSVNATDMLAGRLPGLFVIKTGGAPGDGSSLYVRGLSTTNNSSPLIVVDGIPNRSLDNLNPNDIQSISILKDAASIAVYGARAANGVILVTTKKGAIGKPEITFNMNMINQRPTQVYKTLNAYQYASLFNEALMNEDSYNPDLGQGWSDAELQKFKDGSDPDHYPNTNWVKEVLAPSIWQSSYNLSASGGTENTKYYLSAGYANDQGLSL